MYLGKNFSEQKMETYLARLPRVIRNLRLLCSDRGYEGFPDDFDYFSKALEKKCSIGEVLSCVVKNGREKVSVIFLDPIFDLAKNREVMTSSYQLRGILEDNHVLAISFAKLSPDATKEAQKLKKELEVLTFATLAFPLSIHRLVPRHTALSQDEALEFEKVRGLQRSKLPILRTSDPVAVWYGWSRNTVVRIERSTGVVWRCVK